MTISNEAVEAAAKGLARHKWPTAMGVWESFGQGMQDDFRDQARAALEAAAPHMHAYLLAELRDREGKLARVEAARRELFDLSNDDDWNSLHRAAYRDASRAINTALRAAVAAAGGGGEA